MKNQKFSGKDINDKLMKEAGFVRCPVMDNPKFNACGNISYWINSNGIRIVTGKDERINLSRLVELVANNVAYITRHQIRVQLASIDVGVKGFVSPKKS